MSETDHVALFFACLAAAMAVHLIVWSVRRIRRRREAK